MNPPPTDQPPLPEMSSESSYLEAVAPSPSIANATPNYGTAPVHPPYAEMIMAAITALKEVEGSSKQAIAKYIERAYPNLPAAHPALLTHHLKRLKNSGQLLLFKKSYMLPAPGSDLPPPPPAEFSAPTTEKRRPGRPPKPKTPSDDAINYPTNTGSVSAKRRGRPPKPKPAPPGFEFQNHLPLQQQPVYAPEPLASNDPTATALLNGSASPKRRGRPRKYLPTSSLGEQAPPTTYTVGSADVGGAALVKKGPGRPPKTPGSRPRGRPRKIGDDGLPTLPVRQLTPSSSGRPRGRPRKRPLLSVDGATVVAPVGIKRRGRPRGVTGPRKLMIMRTGRPRGRPRKNASIVGTHASRESEVVANVELTRKLEYMQLKVKNAVGLLKPHLINTNIIDILTAIQDLEELSTMDITAQTTTATETAPVAEPVAPVMVDQEMAPPPCDIATPQLDLSAPAYPDPGAVGQLPTMTFN